MESKIFYSIILLLLISLPILYFTFESIASERKRLSDVGERGKERERQKATFWLGVAFGGGYVVALIFTGMALLDEL
jgi:hypothetical protein